MNLNLNVLQYNFRLKKKIFGTILIVCFALFFSFSLIFNFKYEFQQH